MVEIGARNHKSLKKSMKLHSDEVAPKTRTIFSRNSRRCSAKRSVFVTHFSSVHRFFSALAKYHVYRVHVCAFLFRFSWLDVCMCRLIFAFAGNFPRC